VIRLSHKEALIKARVFCSNSCAAAAIEIRSHTTRLKRMHSTAFTNEPESKKYSL
jgi:hypothetical protein